MTSAVRTPLSKFCAVWLLVLGIMPFTAPFATCDVTSNATSPAAAHELNDVVIKCRVSPEAATADLNPTFVLADTVVAEETPSIGLAWRIISRPDRHSVLRI